MTGEVLPSDLEQLVRRAISRDDSGEECPVAVSVLAFDELCEALKDFHRDGASRYEWWDKKDYADVVQYSLVGLVSCMTRPVLSTASANLQFGLALAELIATRNGYVFDASNCEFFLDFLFSSGMYDGVSTDDDALLADLRVMLCENLLHPDDVNSLELNVDDGGVLDEDFGTTLFIAPPMTGVRGADLVQMTELCDRIEDIFRRSGVVARVHQPIRYANPEEHPETSIDSLHNRRTDIDNILGSDIVVVILLRPATGLGTVLGWAERGGSARLVLAYGEAADSPLPKSAPGVDCRPLQERDLERSIAEFLADHQDAIAAHRELRSLRRSKRLAEFKAFREAARRMGANGIAAALPGWFPPTRTFEILRTLNQFSATTTEEYEALAKALGMEPVAEHAPRGLRVKDIDDALRFAVKHNLSRDLERKLLKRAALELSSGQHFKQGDSYWEDVLARCLDDD